MTVGNKNFDEISEADLAELIEVGVPEGVLVDYKCTGYGNADADVKEFLKDISSFANTSGGHLIIGMEETEGVASALSPLSGVDPDKVLQRMESLVRDGIEPRVTGIRMKCVPASDGGSVFVIRVPRSWNPPHRVSVRNTNRFYARTSAGAYEVSVDELRVLFNRAATAHERVRAFRNERLARIDGGETPVPLAMGEGRLILHIVPLSAFGLDEQMDLEQAYQSHQEFRPIGAMGMTPRVNFDGIINIRGGDQCHGYTQMFRNGIIEATKVDILREGEGTLFLPSTATESQIVEVVPMYMRALADLNIPPPAVLMISLQNVKGAVLAVGEELAFFDSPTPFYENTLELPEVWFETYQDEPTYQRALVPIFNALWNAAGYFKSKNVDSEGNWVRC